MKRLSGITVLKNSTGRPVNVYKSESKLRVDCKGDRAIIAGSVGSNSHESSYFTIASNQVGVLEQFSIESKARLNITRTDDKIN